MAELEEALAALVAEDPDMADLEDLVDKLLTPELERFEKEHVEPLAKIIEEVSIKAEPIAESIKEIDSIFKSTRVMAEDLQANLLKEKMEIDQLIIDSNDAQQRTESNESQLFQSKISTSNPFNLFYLYRSMGKKSNTASPNTSTTPATIQTSTTDSPGAKKSSSNNNSSSHTGDVSGSSQAVSKGNDTSQHTKVTNMPRDQSNKEPELIDLCGGTDEVAQLDPDSFEVPDQEQLINKTAEIARGMKLLAKKKGVSTLNEWYEATLLNIITDQGNKKFKVKFDTMGKRLLSGKHIALKTHPTFEQLKMGSRVVANYNRVTDGDKPPSVYSGIIAELPMITNKGRFLIFYDIGYAQYVDLEDMYLVYQPATKVWEDDMGDSKDFIMKYLNRYPERPMVRLAVGQWAKTEWNGVWWRAKVKEVQGSLALMHFESDDREEWIYRGSPRLEPLFTELQKAEEAKRSGNRLVASGTSNPYKKRRPTRVEYTIVMKQQLVMPKGKNVARKSTSITKSPEVRKKKGQTALKSTSMNREHHKKHRKSPSPTPTPDIFELDDSEENSRSDDVTASNVSNEGALTSASPSTASPSTLSPSTFILTQPVVQPPRTNPTVAELLIAPSIFIQQQIQHPPQQLDPLQHITQQYQLQQQQLMQLQQQQQQQQQQREKTVKRKKRKNQKTFVAHTCNYYCVINCWPAEQNKTFNKNPLRLPEICGWSRELAKMKGSGKRHVLYRTPCGRLLRGMDEINRYLKETSINYLSVDHFTFDPFVYTLTRKPRVKPIWKIDDISKGQEPMPVSCVNELDSSPLPSVEYVAHRLPSGGTEINLDKSFLTCCDCTDNCMDKSKCACWQMTVESTGVSSSGLKDPNAGYKNRRLPDHLPTGVFECNTECKCSQQCHNRVVQYGIKLRLQVFKTNKRGWGLRCLDDIPKGAFVCIYAGQIWKEDMANERGRIYGDEYFAELDYIEVVENNKEGYESDVASCDMSDRGYNTSDESANEEGSDVDYHAGSDSDADYVPGGGGWGARVGAVAGAKGGGSSQSDAGSVEDPDNPKKELAQVSTRLTFRRQTSAQRATEQQWSVVPSNKENPDKVEEWVKDLPTDEPTPSTSLQEANNTTPTKAPSGSASEPDTPSRLYGYNTNPGNVLDSKALEAYRKRKEKEKALRRRKLDGESPSKPASSGDAMGDNAITLSSSDEEDSKGSNIAHRNASPASKTSTPGIEPSTPGGKATTPNGKPNTPGGIPTTPNSHPVTPGASTSGGGGKDVVMSEGGIQGFGGFQIEGITSLAVESDDTDESDTEETKMAKGDCKKTTSSQPKSTTQHSMMSMMVPPSGPPTRPQNQGDGNRRAAPMRTRPFFGEEHHYIMDAKFIGNLGRYLNHSCSPNLFVQNVFVDTHDLRFPWVAFFAHERIRASTELTWDYNYDVGSVPGKSLPCYCGSNVCKGRLL